MFLPSRKRLVLLLKKRRRRKTNSSVRTLSVPSLSYPRVYESTDGTEKGKTRTKVSKAAHTLEARINGLAGFSKRTDNLERRLPPRIFEIYRLTAARD